MIKKILLFLSPFAFPFLALSTEPTVKLGMSNALSGPASDLGTQLHLGSTVFFDSLNKNGGIHGQSVELISLDDGYEPELTVANTRQLIEKEKVLALFGYVGTPTSHAIMPMVNKSNIPYLMPFTGADFLREPINKNIYNFRASYHQEAQAQVSFLVNTMKYKDIALVIQADEFGLAAQRAIITELSKYNLQVKVNARYKRNTQDMSRVLTKLKEHPIEAVIFIGTYEPFSQLINLAHQQNLSAVFTSLSFIGSHDVFTRLDQMSRVMITEVVPDPNNCAWLICQHFRDDMKSFGITSVNRIQLEGYLNAYIFSEVAKQCGVELTRECLLAKFETFSMQDKTLLIHFDKSNHQGSQSIYHSFSPNFNPEIPTR